MSKRNEVSRHFFGNFSIDNTFVYYSFFRMENYQKQEGISFELIRRLILMHKFRGLLLEDDFDI